MSVDVSDILEEFVETVALAEGGRGTVFLSGYPAGRPALDDPSYRFVVGVCNESAYRPDYASRLAATEETLQRVAEALEAQGLTVEQDIVSWWRQLGRWQELGGDG